VDAAGLVSGGYIESASSLYNVTVADGDYTITAVSGGSCA
jgi:hypothetical protein